MPYKSKAHWRFGAWRFSPKRHRQWVKESPPYEDLPEKLKKTEEGVIREYIRKIISEMPHIQVGDKLIDFQVEKWDLGDEVDEKEVRKIIASIIYKYSEQISNYKSIDNIVDFVMEKLSSDISKYVNSNKTNIKVLDDR